MRSMTGYGACSLEEDGRQVTIELKSVNHRFLDISLRAPRTLAFAEEAMKRQIAARLARGHVEALVSYKNQRLDARRVQVDEGLARQYLEAYTKLNGILNIDPEAGLDRVALQPDVIVLSEAPEDEEAVSALLSKALDGALDRLIAMREREGARMRLALMEILDEIEGYRCQIEKRYPETIQLYEARLKERLIQLLGEGADMTRVMQEAAIMADKAAINEETVRLRTHLEHARQLCDSAEPAGRSLDVLVQEMNREVNTISSKSQDIPITQAVLQSKSAIEKLREQLQNVE